MQLISSSIVPSSVDDFWQEPDSIREISGPCTVLVLSRPFAAGSTEEETLLKMLSACRLTSADYRILQMSAGQRWGWPLLRDRLQPRYVLLLGVEPAQLGLSVLFRFHETNSFNDCFWIPSATITELNNNPALKAQFWNQALKPVFAP